MGSGEENTPSKPTKPATATQELPTTPSYPDWASPMQTYYGAGASTPPPFFPSTVASSPPPHPYLWGGQHLMPPYGTPLPYPAMYPHGGIYGHPPMAAAQGMIMTATETEGKSSDVKDKGLVKSKGSSGNTGLASGKSGDGGKAASGSANDGASQSGESGSEGSSDASDENNNHQEFSAARKKSFDQMIADGANAQHNNTVHYSGSALESSFSARGQPAAKLPITVPGKPAVSVPTTNLNIGMDLWNNTAPVGSVPIKARPNAPGVSQAIVPGPMVGREGVMPEHQWMQDERELKRQRRKQSNRESARRSRLRKQAECEELAGKVETLNNENRSLRSELQRLAEECQKLTSENASIVEQLNQLYEHDAVSSVEVNDANTSGFQSADEGMGHVLNASRGSSSVSGPNGKFFSSNGKHESGSN
ncbi:G-box-binding factor 1-like protein isoform X1 [Cinnamomum micranthum f. kanehirae]|uniref:G-box-binding factor 1-like protein isoform X1 n=1 Tax=Cinnamomum micranthum f. kanehirae TaxID=337451 RepID=A0A3S4PWE6_9MAGN|nr:G-box-binding factor 1-like protein isoform X1 [Cinnamomum micranthum f. kanehirae]